MAGVSELFQYIINIERLEQLMYYSRWSKRDRLIVSSKTLWQTSAPEELIYLPQKLTETTPCESGVFWRKKGCRWLGW